MSFNIGQDVLPHEYKGAIYNRESANRLRWIKFAFVCMFSIFIARTLQLGLQSNDVGKYNGLSNEIESRADIVDRNGVVLAKSVKSGNIKLFPLNFRCSIIDCSNRARISLDLITIGIDKINFVWRNDKNIVWIYIAQYDIPVV